MSKEHSDVLIIGAGMSGLTCAQALAQAGLSVMVLDKGRGPGGRMAARRAEVSGESVSFDHGAQYFTARDSQFREKVAEWEAQGVVARWRATGDEAWVGVPGMNGPIRAMARGLDVRWGTRAVAFTKCNPGWFVDAGEDDFSADIVLVAIPAEQAGELLAVTVPELAETAQSVVSEPCWAVMAAFDERLAIEADTLRDPQAKISWAARNSAKPQRTGKECWVLHASPARSREFIDMSKEQASEILLADFFAQTEIEPVVPIHLAAHRWLYAMPAAIKGEPARFDAEARIGLAGDYLHSPRVEGAWISGKVLAELVLKHHQN